MWPKIRVGHQTTNEFMEQSPSIHNSNCHTACFEFLPFQLGGELLPKFAISLNDKNQIFIGRCKVLNADGYFLCKIVLNRSDAIEVIGFRRMQPLEESLEVKCYRAGSDWKFKSYFWSFCSCCSVKVFCGRSTPTTATDNFTFNSNRNCWRGIRTTFNWSTRLLLDNIIWLTMIWLLVKQRFWMVFVIIRDVLLCKLGR